MIKAPSPSPSALTHSPSTSAFRSLTADKTTAMREQLVKEMERIRHLQPLALNITYAMSRDIKNVYALIIKGILEQVKRAVPFTLSDLLKNPTMSYSTIIKICNEREKIHIAVKQKEKQLPTLLEQHELAMCKVLLANQHRMTGFLTSYYSLEEIAILSAFFQSPHFEGVTRNLNKISHLIMELLADVSKKAQQDIDEACTWFLNYHYIPPLVEESLIGIEESHLAVAEPAAIDEPETLTQVKRLVDLQIEQSTTEALEKQKALLSSMLLELRNQLPKTFIEPSERLQAISMCQVLVPMFEKAVLSIVAKYSPKIRATLIRERSQLIACFMVHFSKEEINVLYAYKISPRYHFIHNKLETLVPVVMELLKDKNTAFLKAATNIEKA